GGAFPFAIRPVFGVAPDGHRNMLISTSLGGGERGTIRVTAVDVWGDTLYVTEAPFTGVGIPRQVADSAIAARATFYRMNADLAAAYRQIARVPPVYPPVEGVVVGKDGAVWIKLRPFD